jgi:hypothetical protein
MQTILTEGRETRKLKSKKKKKKTWQAIPVDGREDDRLRNQILGMQRNRLSTQNTWNQEKQSRWQCRRTKSLEYKETKSLECRETD